MAKADVYDVLSSIAEDINNDFKLEVATPGRDEVQGEVKMWLPTSSLMLNMIFGRRDSTGVHLGLPVGRICEIFGDFSHGKSTILQHIMNAYQAAGGLSNLLDYESSWDRERSIKMGHDVDRNLHIEVDTVERGFDVLYSLNDKYYDTFSGRIPIMYGWDTMAAAPTEGEKEGDEFSKGMGYKARLIRQQLRRLTGELGKNNASLYVLNQVIDQFNRPGKTTPGGSGLKFWSSNRLEVRRVASFNDPETKEQLGIISKIKMKKNKIWKPNLELDVPIMFETGIDPVWEVVNYHLDNTSHVNVSGARTKFPDFDISVYRKEVPDVFKENPEYLTYLQERAVEHFFKVDEFHFDT